MACIDEWGEFQVKFESWRLPATYSDVEYLATGAFGSVCVAFDSKLKMKVAIKRCAMVFLSIDKTLSVFKEITLLSQLKHANIVKILNVLIPTSEAEGDASLNIYLILEKCDKTLAQIIESEPLVEYQIRHILFQTLQGLSYIHSAGIVHRDINPYNIMVNNTGVIKIIDFGLACRVSEVSTAYISTWWNTAPEIILSLPADQRVDIWSVGCILFQMVARHPLFVSTNKSHVLTQIMDTFVIEPLDWIETISDKRLYETANKYKETGKKKLAELLAFLSKNLISCLENLFTFDPKLRPSAEQALAHIFMNTPTSTVHIHTQTNEFTDCPLPSNLLDTSIEELRKLLFEFITHSTNYDK